MQFLYTNGLRAVVCISLTWTYTSNDKVEPNLTESNTRELTWLMEKQTAC